MGLKFHISTNFDVKKEFSYLVFNLLLIVVYRTYTMLSPLFDNCGPLRTFSYSHLQILWTTPNIDFFC
jgi:hypothetical protein